jgi:DNA-binding response OmpR family regulator
MNANSDHLVMLIDDDPSHLKLYTWVIERGGFSVHPVLATGSVETLPLASASVYVLDYRLGPIDPIKVAKRARTIAPASPILILSDSLWMPEEFVGLTSEFLRKGEPQELVDRLHALVART